MKTLFQDRDGNISSKRVIGVILAVVGLIMKIILFFIAIGITIENPEIMKEISSTLLFAGVGLLGVSVIEHLKPSENIINNQSSGK
jgi:high-affinity Fe2+/Pb2+ permease